ncbi:HAMP domain-containing histidine kinase [Nonomuraea sp. RK-328]|nr:HAMP domain-containing histidine kinase [Nonomuraea sp. RK-328]
MRRFSSLRSRLTLLVTVAVTLAIATASAMSWFIAQNQMIRTLDQAIMEHESPGDQEWLKRHCRPEGTDDPFGGNVTLLLTDGSICAVGKPIVVTEEDKAFVAHPGLPVYRNGQTSDGRAVRVVTQPYEPGIAVLESRPLKHVQSSLRQMAFGLAGLTALGALLAAWTGLAISRAALAPVGRLTKAVEHIAQTQDLGTHIPVQGTDEIARLGTSFNAMTTALAGSQERQRQLVADAGHELRTPLTTLRTNIDLLLRSEETGRSIEPGAKKRLLVNVKAQFAELSTLVGDLLQLARGDTDHEPHAELGLHDVVRAAVERARLRGAEVTTDLGEWYVVGGAASLERAVLNLIDNAAKFGPGQVDVVLRAGTLTVRDHGPGIAEEELPHVFDRFWRSPSARAMPGSGLGLAIVAQSVAEAGGQVRLDNAPGGGVIATVEIPGKSHPALR